jgi:hypothetical protein
MRFVKIPQRRLREKALVGAGRFGRAYPTRADKSNVSDARVAPDPSAAATVRHLINVRTAKALGLTVRDAVGDR